MTFDVNSEFSITSEFKSKQFRSEVLDDMQTTDSLDLKSEQLLLKDLATLKF